MVRCQLLGKHLGEEHRMGESGRNEWMISTHLMYPEQHPKYRSPLLETTTEDAETHFRLRHRRGRVNPYPVLKSPSANHLADSQRTLRITTMSGTGKVGKRMMTTQTKRNNGPTGRATRGKRTGTGEARGGMTMVGEMQSGAQRTGGHNRQGWIAPAISTEQQAIQRKSKRPATEPEDKSHIQTKSSPQWKVTKSKGVIGRPPKWQNLESLSTAQHPNFPLIMRFLLSRSNPNADLSPQHSETSILLSRSESWSVGNFF